MRTYLALRALARAVREWWRRQHDVPRRPVIDPIDAVLALRDPNVAALQLATERGRSMQGYEKSRTRALHNDAQTGAFIPRGKVTA
jgi:hypothetical protein